jgi:hypothetical protein
LVYLPLPLVLAIEVGIAVLSRLRKFGDQEILFRVIPKTSREALAERFCCPSGSQPGESTSEKSLSTCRCGTLRNRIHTL